MDKLDRATLVLIAVNTVLLIAAEITHSEVIELMEDACLWLFSVELVYRWHRARYKASWMLVFETAVVVLAFLPALAVNATVLRAARLAKVTHLFKHITHLRWWRVMWNGVVRRGVAT